LILLFRYNFLFSSETSRHKRTDMVTFY